MKIYYTRAYWADGKETSDIHHTEEQAVAVAKKLWNEGNDRGKPERTEALWEDEDGRRQEIIAYSKVFPTGNVTTGDITSER